MSAADAQPRAAVLRGPPWIGPVTTRRAYEQNYLWIHAAMLVSATIYFGWRALWLTAVMAGATLVATLLIGIVIQLLRGRWPAPVSPQYAVNMGLLLPLTAPLTGHTGYAAIVGAGLGLAVHLMGPAHRIRVHPVALAHVLVFLVVPIGEPRGVQAVLAPTQVAVGDVLKAAEYTGGPNWAAMRIIEPNEAIRRDDPHRVMLAEQRKILTQEMWLADLMRQTDRSHGQITTERVHLPRLIDVLLGATPGPLGATSALLIVILGIFLMQRRVSHWPMVVVALCSGIICLFLLPIGDGPDLTISLIQMRQIGWRVSVSYFAYQLLASPFLLIVLLMAPLTMPRTAEGRMVYAVWIGAGTLAARWFMPYESLSYLPLVVGGLLGPWLDRLRRLRYVHPLG